MDISLGRLVFVYYILCYSVGLIGFLVAFLSAAVRSGTIGALRDRRFAVLSGVFAFIVIPYSALAYLDSVGRPGFLPVIVLTVISFMGDASLVVALPHFMGGFSEPPRSLRSRTSWIALSALAAAGACIFIVALDSPLGRNALNVTFICMIAAILESFVSGKRAMAALGAKVSDDSLEADDRDEACRWLRILRGATLACAVALTPMLIVDFFPMSTVWRIPGFPYVFRIFPLLYAVLNGIYAAESLKPFLASGRRFGVGTSSSGSGIDAGGDSPAFLGRESAMAGLSLREVEVARLLADGATYKDICWTLRIRMGTVQSHVVSVYHKLGVNCKEDLMRLARGEDTP